MAKACPVKLYQEVREPDKILEFGRLVWRGTVIMGVVFAIGRGA